MTAILRYKKSQETECKRSDNALVLFTCFDSNSFYLFSCTHYFCINDFPGGVVGYVAWEGIVMLFKMFVIFI